MKYTLIGLLAICFMGCAKEQHANGYIIDQDTELPIEDVKVWKATGAKGFEKSNEFGFFTYAENLGILGHRKSMELIFEKEGYKTLRKNLHQDTIEIKLVKDLSRFENVRGAVMDTIRKIEQDNFISTGIVGIAGKRPQQANRRYWLRKEANKEELIQLINYPNAVVKGVVFKILYVKKYPALSDLLIKLSAQKGWVHFRSGCTGRTIQIGEYCFTEVMNYDLEGGIILRPPLPEDYQRRVELKEEDKAIIIENIMRVSQKEIYQ